MAGHRRHRGVETDDVDGLEVDLPDLRVRVCGYADRSQRGADASRIAHAGGNPQRWPVDVVGG